MFGLPSLGGVTSKPELSSPGTLVYPCYSLIGVLIFVHLHNECTPKPDSNHEGPI